MMNNMDTIQQLMDELRATKALVEKLRSEINLLKEDNASLCAENSKLKGRVKELEEQKSKNSSNSSKPPSTDNKKSRRKNLRKKSGRSQGGQPGHKGSTLNMSANPDHTILSPANFCTCGCDLSGAPLEGIEKRQKHDLPEKTTLEVTEVQSEIKTCPCCGLEVRGDFPEDMKAPVQYGPRVQAAAAYLMNYQLIPFDRVAEFFKDFFDAEISVGTLSNIQRKLSRNLEDFTEKVKELLTNAEVAHFDETGIRVNGKRYWLHVACTSEGTYYFVHEKRGREAINEAGILPFFNGVAVHDNYSTYYTYECLHAECCAHILRELKFLFEERERVWAGQLSTLLVEAKEHVERAMEMGYSELNPLLFETLDQAYDQIIESALEVHPPPQPIPGKRGKPKGTKESNILVRLKDFKEEILRFMNDFRVPFDNNQGERDIRMTKVKQKISGCFRTESGADDWTRIRGYISTARKNGASALDALSDAVMGNAHIPIRV